MADYKNQHFLPLVYLGQFARPPDRELRKRTIWRVSPTQVGEVPVRTQCQEDYFYSKHRARLCEGYFGTIETVYGQLMKRLVKGETVSHEDLFLLFLCAVDFYARGSKFHARSDREEFELYLHRMEIFKSQLINAELANSSDDERRDYILKHWDFGLIQFSEEAAILTSDSPSVWLGSKHVLGQLCGVIMPLSPLCCFVAANRTTYRIIRNPATPEDAYIVNINEIENCVDAVFSSEPVTAKEIVVIREKLSKRTTSKKFPNTWMLELIDYDENPGLSFLGVV